MCLVTWRVSGSDFDVDEFLRRFPQLDDCDIWHKGDRAPLRQVFSDSGFSLTVFENKSSLGAMSAIRQAMEELIDIRAALGGLRVSNELSIGLFVGSSDSFVATFSFSVEDMRFLADAGISVDIAGYPTSDA